MGVQETPYFDIPVHRYIRPVLHTLIGVGNAILDYLIDIVESEIQAIPAKEIRLRREIREIKAEIKDLRAEKDEWESLTVGSGKDQLKQAKKGNGGGKEKTGKDGGRW